MWKKHTMPDNLQFCIPNKSNLTLVPHMGVGTILKSQS